MVNFYKVGGAVRDELLGIKAKDLDYAVEAPSYDAFKRAVIDLGGEIFQEREQFLTLRANVPGMGAADFVMCRKDGFYADGRRPLTVEPGTIYDDLARRDFTVNALAVGPLPKLDLLDPHKGLMDLKGKMLRCVGRATDRFTEDGLRMLRALRFNITKGLILDAPIVDCLTKRSFWETRLVGVSEERIREELYKCFAHDTAVTLATFDMYRQLRAYLFKQGGLWLKPTLEGR